MSRTTLADLANTLPHKVASRIDRGDLEALMTRRRRQGAHVETDIRTAMVRPADSG